MQVEFCRSLQIILHNNVFRIVNSLAKNEILDFQLYFSKYEQNIHFMKKYVS